MSAVLRRNASWMLAATAVMNLCMLVYHRLMSQRLGDAYGELAVLTALINVLGVLSLGASTTLVKLFAEDAEAGGPGAAKGRFLALARPLGRMMAWAGFALCAASPLLVRALALTGYGPYALASLALTLGLATLTARAAVQGAGFFGALALSVSAEGVVALACAAAFVSAGTGAGGALGGIVLGQAAAFAACAAALRELGPAIPPRASAGLETREMTADAAALGLFTLIAHLDLFAIKHAVDAGPGAAYARAALVAKSLLYLTAALNMALLPAVSAARARGDDGEARGMLLLCLGAALALETFGLTAIGCLTRFVIRLLCGPDESFLALIPLVRAYAAAVVPLALTQPVLYYLLAARDYRALWLLGATAAVYAGTLRSAAGDPFRTVLCLGLASTALLIGTLTLALRDKKR